MRNAHGFGQHFLGDEVAQGLQQLELGPFGITVNSVAPGFILSNPSTQKQWQAFGPDGRSRNDVPEFGAASQA